MTREEILAMEAGEELDSVTAEQFFGVSRSAHLVHFRYSTDPLATWQVLRKLREEFWCIEIKIADGCWVILELLRTPPIRVEVNAGTPFERLPEAICKAALLAKLEAGND